MICQNMGCGGVSVVLFHILTWSLVLQSSFGQVLFTYEQECSNVDQNMTVKAVYTGSETVSQVLWYYNGSSQDLAIKTDCTPFGSVPSGFPEARLSYRCPSTHSLPANTFELTLTNLTLDDLSKTWGATFALVGVASPPINLSAIETCEPTAATTTAPTKDDDGGLSDWEIALIVVCPIVVGGGGGAVAAVVVLYKKKMGFFKKSETGGSPTELADGNNTEDSSYKARPLPPKPGRGEVPGKKQVLEPIKKE